MKIINNFYGLIFNILLTALVLVLIYACQPPPPDIDPRSLDLHPPTPPTNLKATAFSISQINLSWEASFDSVGVKGYYIYRNGKKLPKTAEGTKFSDTGLETGKSYSYTVEAYDNGMPINTSQMSESASAATQKNSRKVVEDWFEFAQKKEWNNMESIARQAWILDGVFCPWLCAKEIAWHYRSITIDSYIITTISDKGEKLHRYQVIVKTPSGDETMQVKVYKESVSGQESWGVDPIIL